jgi:hypothetical protein
MQSLGGLQQLGFAACRSVQRVLSIGELAR